MKKNQLKNLIFITVLILATGGAMAYSSNRPGGFFSNWISGSPHIHPGNDETLKASGHLVQNKVLLGSDGTVGLSLTLQADDLAVGDSPEARNVDMVIVLDRSGSMQGQKLKDARRAVLKLLSNLSAKDRFAMVTYSDGVQIASKLVNVTQDSRVHLVTAVNSIRAGGGTNLGAGLQEGIKALTRAEPAATKTTMRRKAGRVNPWRDDAFIVTPSCSIRVRPSRRGRSPPHARPMRDSARSAASRDRWWRR